VRLKVENHLVDLVAHVFDVLKNDLKSDVCKELFLYYQATPVVLQYLKPINKVKMNDERQQTPLFLKAKDCKVRLKVENHL
jgi:hypothetical protein